MAKRFVIKKKSAAIVIKKDGASGDWLFKHGADTHGPMSLPELKNAVTAGLLRPDDEVWRVDNPAHARAGWLPWLFPDGEGFRAASGTEQAAASVACPACRATFAPEEALFVARHTELPPDFLLGPGHAYRFRPTRFTPEGAAIDPGGEITTETACPACHASLAAPVAAPSAPGLRAAGRAAPRDKDAPERLPPHLATSDGVKQLVTEIRGILARTGSTRLVGDVLARQYAELCRRAATRLALCQQFMQHGQRSEAFDQANQPPPLLDLCALLPFPDLDQWQQLCARSRWAVPAAIDTSAVAAVAACCREAAPLEPALAALRSAVSRGLPTETLQVLRTLMLMDADNLNWGVDVAAFEEVRQAELFETAVAAIEAGDLAALSAPAAELLDAWVSPPDPHPLAVVKAELGRLRGVEAGQRGVEISRRFASACDAQDYPAAAEADAAYNALLAAGHFEPDDATRQTIASCRDWFVAAAARHQTDDAFARDLAALQAALAQPQAGEEVARLCDSLRAYGRDLPAEPLAQAGRVIRRHRARLAWRRRLRAAARIAAVAVPVLALAFAGWRAGLNHQRQAWRTRLEQALAGDDLAAFDRTIDDLRRSALPYGSALTRWPPIAAQCDRRAELAARVQGRASSYQTVLASLQQIQAQGFVAPADEVLARLAQGQAAAKTLDQLAALEKFETPWRADQTARLAQRLAQLPPAPPALGVFATQPFGAAMLAVTQYCAQVDAAAALKGADATARARLAPILAMAGDCRGMLAVRLATLQPALQATNLDAYLDALVRFSDRFTNDTLTLQMGETLFRRKEYRAALHAAADLRQHTAALAAGDAWPQARKAIVALREVKSLTDLRWAVRKDTGDLVFVAGREKSEAASHGRWAECYQPQSGDTAPAYKRLKVVDDPPYHDGFSDRPSRPWFHTDWVSAMLAQVVAINGADEGARFVEAHIRSVAPLAAWNGKDAPGTNELPNVAFKIQYLVFFAEQMTRLSPLPEWRLILEALRGADNPDANWSCLKSGAVRQIDRAGPDILARIFAPGGLLTRLDVRRAAGELAGRTPLAWAGHVDFGAPETIHWKLDPPAEFAVLRLDANRKPVIVIAGTPGQVRIPLVPGEPVLCWSDGAATTQKIAALAPLLPGLDAGVIAATVPEWFPREAGR